MGRKVISNRGANEPTKNKAVILRFLLFGVQR